MDKPLCRGWFYTALGLYVSAINRLQKLSGSQLSISRSRVRATSALTIKSEFTYCTLAIAIPRAPLSNVGGTTGAQVVDCG